MALLSLPFIVDLVAKASVILAVTALVAAALRHASASARHFVWTLGLLSALAAPVLALALPRWELPIIRIAAQPATASSASLSLPAAHGSSDLAHTAPVAHAAAVTTSDRVANAAPAANSPDVPAQRSLPSWPSLALFAWIVGAAAVVARMLLGLIAVQWMSRRLPIVANAPWLAQARGLAEEFGLHDVRFLRGGAGTMPMAWGIV